MLGMGFGSPFAFLRDISQFLYIIVMVGLALALIALVYLPFELKKSKTKDN